MREHGGGLKRSGKIKDHHAENQKMNALFIFSDVYWVFGEKLKKNFQAEAQDNYCG